MNLFAGKGLNSQTEAFLRAHVETQCFLCLGEFDTADYAPMMICMNQHSCCAPCMEQLLKTDPQKQISCPTCHAPVNKKTVTKNRLLITLYEIVDTFKRRVGQLQQQLDELRKGGNLDLKTSICSKSQRMISSFVLGLESHSKGMRESTLTTDCTMSKSTTWIGSTQKRRSNLQAYAERQKIEQLKKIARSSKGLEQVTQIRSGYGSIKKIECMEYFTNLRELLLYNNHIKTIQGLNNNIKLNVLSLAYNKIEKVENLGHLKQLKRLSLQCNKLTKSSAQYMLLYDWKNLESLSISFHEQNKEDNDDCFAVLLNSKCSNQWQSLKTLYIYNSRQVGERGRAAVRGFQKSRKTPLQIYWS